ncbi:hypothetical protein LCGC14_2314290, partial [marine sediment metagenome]
MTDEIERVRTYNGGWVELDCAGETGVRMKLSPVNKDDPAVRVTLDDLDRIKAEADLLLSRERQNKRVAAEAAARLSETATKLRPGDRVVRVKPGSGDTAPSVGRLGTVLDTYIDVVVQFDGDDRSQARR